MNLFNSLKSRLIFSMMMVVLLTAVILSWSIVKEERTRIYQQVEGELTVLSRLIASSTTAALLFQDDEAAGKTLGGLSEKPAVIRADIYDSEGNIFSTYSKDGTLALADMDSVQRVIQSGDILLDQHDGKLSIYMPIVSEGELIGLVYLADNLAGLEQTLNQFYSVVGITAMYAIFLSFILTLWLQRLFTAPLRQIISVMRKITSDNDYRQSPPVSNIAEFKMLSESFSHMIKEIDDRDRELKSINVELENRVYERTQELESALVLANESSREKSEFLAVMSHEVRTPLNGIIGFSEYLSTQSFNPEANKCIEMMNVSAHSLLNLLNEILDFSKLDANKLELSKNDFSLRALLSGAIDSCAALVMQKGLAIQVTINDDLHDNYCGDSMRIRQILSNFVSNAVKFTEQGRIDIQVSSVEQNSETLMTFRVVDTGEGIPTDRLDELFTPFIQVDHSATRKQGGTGLGLAICKQLAELMDGSYGVESELGSGSCFWFTIPLTKVSEEHKTLQAQSPVEHDLGTPGNILVAEDNQTNQLVIRKLLQTFGHTTEIVETGVDIVAKAKDTPYDLIFMDYHMPLMDGIEATEMIRSFGSESANYQTPIIALTADIQPQVNRKFRHAGANDTLLKPVTRMSLDNCLKKWLAKKVNNVSALHNAQDSSEILNPVYLSEIASLSTNPEDDVARQVIRLYFDNAVELIEAIQKAMQSNNRSGVFAAAHQLKSSSANLGAERLAEMAERYEKFSLEPDSSGDDLSEDVLLDCFIQARRAIEEIYGVVE